MSGDADRSPDLVDRVRAAVAEDVAAGLGPLLQQLDFAFVGPFTERGALVDAPYVVVEWRYTGVDNGDGFNGMWPTGKQVVVPGLTIVDTSPDQWLFHRHVDWNTVNSQLGGSRGRASTPLPVKRPDEARFYAALHYEFDGVADGTP